MGEVTWLPVSLCDRMLRFRYHQSHQATPGTPPFRPEATRSMPCLTARRRGHQEIDRKRQRALEEEQVTVTGIITALIVGLIVGALGRLVVPGRQSMSILVTMVVGVIAALLGTVLAHAIGISTDTPGVDWGELLVQVLLAAVGVALVAGLSGRGRRAL
jgi:uncharacterized membrane protein YeaQ/YmgE (transglycosylase-associated protein family)